MASSARLLAAADGDTKTDLAEHIGDCLFRAIDLPTRHPAHLCSEGRTDAAAFFPDHGLHADFHHLLHVRRRSCRRSTDAGIGSGVGSEQVALFLLNDMAERLPGVRMLLILFLSAAVAAIMSTVDSALLAVSSVFTQDLYKRIRPDVSQHHLIVTGKVFSWGLMAALVFLAIQLPQTLWRLTEIKLELLCQVAPAIFLGVHLKSLRTHAVLSGLLVGTCVALAIMFANLVGMGVATKPLGIHAGVWGLAANFLTLGIVSKVVGIRRMP